MMTPGTRVRFNANSAWPERVGAEGMVVAPKVDGTYPQPARGEVIVFLDRDPLTDHRGRASKVWWSCVTTLDTLDEV